jgi:hypothetical protein
MMVVMATQPRLRDPFIRRVGSGFEVWADEYVPNQPGAASTARALRGLIADEIRVLPAPEGRVLRAGYGGWRWHGTDVENLLFNNIDQGLSLFRKPGRAAVGFEDLGLTVPYTSVGDYGALSFSSPSGTNITNLTADFSWLTGNVVHGVSSCS